MYTGGKEEVLGLSLKVLPFAGEKAMAVLLPGKSHGWRSLVGYSPWGREESDTVRYSSGQGRKRKDDLNRSRLPLFRQGGTTVSLMTRLSEERDQGGSIFVGRLVEAIRETLIRWDVWGIF